MRQVTGLRIAYGAGILMDAVAALQMLFPRLLIRTYGVDFPLPPRFVFAMRYGAPRMIGWTVLLYRAERMFFPLRYGYGLMYFQLPRFFWPTPLPELIGHSGSTGSFAFVCPSRSTYLAGTINQLANPSKPFFLMIRLLRAMA